jgi:hypothetical protein
LSVSNAEKGRLIKIVGFICPLYEIDESKLDQGFGSAIVSIGSGELREFPRYERKFNRFISLVSSLQEFLKGRFDVELDIIMGDKGVVNADNLREGLGRISGGNMDSYERYLRTHYPEVYGVSCLRLISDLVTHFPEIGGQFSELAEDGRNMSEGKYGFDINGNVAIKIQNELVEARKKGLSEYEVLGFVLNYGLAGMVCRSNGVDVLVGVDQPGSYMNYLYHTFINPKDLFVLVPK